MAYKKVPKLLTLGEVITHTLEYQKLFDRLLSELEEATFDMSISEDEFEELECEINEVRRAIDHNVQVVGKLMTYEIFEMAAVSTEMDPDLFVYDIKVRKPT